MFYDPLKTAGYKTEYGGFPSKYNNATLSQLDMLKEAEVILASAIQSAHEARAEEVLEGDFASSKIDEEIKGNSIKPYEATKTKILSNMKMVSMMEPVEILSGTEFSKKENLKLSEQVEKFFNSIGFVINPDLGQVVINKKGIVDSIAHGISRPKAVAFAAVPKVIENGKIIDAQKNWKNKGYDTVVIAAPIKIGKEEYYQAVIVRRNKKIEQQRFYLHEIIITKKSSSHTRPGLDYKIAGKRTTPVFKLLQQLQDVNSLTDKDIVAQEGQFSIGSGGYDGHSMSNRARRAYDHGEMPLSKWTKSEIISRIEDVSEGVNVELLNKLTRNELINNYLENSSWHHTGQFYNITEFYQINESADFSSEKMQSIINERIKKERIKKTEEEKLARANEIQKEKELRAATDIIYKKLKVIFYSGITGLKKYRSIVARWSKGMDTDKLFAEAVESNKRGYERKIANWKLLPEGHHRHKDVAEYDPDTYVKEYYDFSELNPNRRDKDYKLVKKAVEKAMQDVEDTTAKLSLPDDYDYQYGRTNDTSKLKLSVVDSEGNELSEDQREYFKDSKAVVGNRLAEVYHTTSNG